MEGREVQTLFLRFAALPSLLLIWRMPQLPDRPLRILVIQFRHVGDVLLTTPALKALRDRYPQARIDYLTEPGPSHILRGNPHIDAVILRKRKATLREDWALIRTLRRTQYDLVFDFFSNPTSAILARLSGAPCRVARSRFGRNFLYSHTPVVNHQEDVYSPTHKLALLRAMGVPAAICPPILEIPRESADRIAQFLQDSAIAPEARLVTMDTTSRLADKKWEGQRFLQLADWLTEKHGARVVFIWGPGEKEEVEDLITQGRHAHLLAPPTSLMELAALIAKSHLHIGNCSGPPAYRGGCRHAHPDHHGPHAPGQLDLPLTRTPGPAGQYPVPGLPRAELHPPPPNGGCEGGGRQGCAGKHVRARFDPVAT